MAGLNRRPPACEAGVIATRPTKHLPHCSAAWQAAVVMCGNCDKKTKTPHLRAFNVARLAQSVERKALNLVVVGSSPTVGVFIFTSNLRKCSMRGSNPRLLAHKTNALTTELMGLPWKFRRRLYPDILKISMLHLKFLSVMSQKIKTPTVGLEPTTTRLRALRSTD